MKGTDTKREGGRHLKEEDVAGERAGDAIHKACVQDIRRLVALEVLRVDGDMLAAKALHKRGFKGHDIEVESNAVSSHRSPTRPH